jgi:hypothetical protein
MKSTPWEKILAVACLKAYSIPNSYDDVTLYHLQDVTCGENTGRTLTHEGTTRLDLQ